MADATPPERDRTIDLLRAVSIGVVVLGHWLIAVVTWKDGSIEGENALELIRGTWILTWVLQVMPVFFFVGGFSNRRSVAGADRRGDGYAGYLASRLARLLSPTIVFLAIGLVIVVTLDAANVADDVVFPASTLVTRPLWFLGVYAIVVALAPAMVRLHERFGIAVPLGMLGTAVAVDVIRFGFDVSAVGYVNYPVVWLLAHQLGFFIGPSLERLRVWLLAVGLGGMVVGTTIGPYPGSMVGLSSDEFSNMDPPTLAIVALTLFQIGLVMTARPALSRWLERRGPWSAVILANSVIMTMFLWHLTAMLMAIGLLLPLGFPQPDAGTLQWWLLRPVWIAALAVVLSGLVILFGAAERNAPRPDTAGPRAPGSALVAAAAAVMVTFGILGFALGGMHQLFSTEGSELIVFRTNPASNVLHLILGIGLAVAALRTTHVMRRWSLGAATVLVVLAAIGVGVGGGTNLLALNRPDAAVYAATAVVLVVAALVSRSTRRPSGQGS
jgi:fucose 4-O-acetylase-like acetyltransferase